MVEVGALSGAVSIGLCLVRPRLLLDILLLRERSLRRLLRLRVVLDRLLDLLLVVSRPVVADTARLGVSATTAYAGCPSFM